ncbi:MAG: histidine--tRNA ligase, partial [Bacteroidota bacterium]
MGTPSIPKGTRDFGPEQSQRRQYIFDVIRQVYQQCGYLPIETPAVEKRETLTGKYGEEGDRLIFNILNSGDYLQGIDQSEPLQSGPLTPRISGRALRYDLTVPFARFVVQHRNELTFPFKRYQIQPVWRADRPQKGRYREFYQCDADVIGSRSLLNEVELIQIITEVFQRFQLPDIVVKLNNRKLLAGMAEVLGESDKLTDITVALDKLDKIGPDGVRAELEERAISATAIAQLEPLMHLQGSNAEKLARLEAFLASSTVGLDGVAELRWLFDALGAMDSAAITVDVTLARGLNYYTGSIIEVVHPDFKGSVCGGGRYDDLTGIFGLKDVSGVGISFGADRIYDLMAQKGLFPDALARATDVLFANFGEQEARYCLGLLAELRQQGVRAELYPDAAKMGKQFSYANARNIRYVVLIGSKEMEQGKLGVKDMQSGEQQLLERE